LERDNAGDDLGQLRLAELRRLTLLLDIECLVAAHRDEPADDAQREQENRQGDHDLQ
jgi:hypothetical protein